jgi:hypothetical protein
MYILLYQNAKLEWFSEALSGDVSLSTTGLSSIVSTLTSHLHYNIKFQLNIGKTISFV